MKTLAKISIALALIALLALGAYMLSSNLSVKATVSVMPALEASDAIKGAREKGYELPGDLENYNLVTFTVYVRSYSPFKAEWMSLNMKGGDEDAPVVDSGNWVRELKAFGRLEGDDAMYIYFLSPSESTARQAQLEYYIFGRYHFSNINTEG